MIFDWDRNFHAKALSTFSDPEVLKYDATHSLDQKRVKSELDWRMSGLKVNDRVDVLKAASAKSNGEEVVRSWSRGHVVFKGIPEDIESSSSIVDVSTSGSFQAMKIDVKFENDISARVLRFDLFDARIAPLGTFTDDYEWRYGLKVGDCIDCMDSEKAWYKSTVLATR
jgi:hypothetical protein